MCSGEITFEGTVKGDTLKCDTASRKEIQQNTAENNKSPIKIIVETDPKTDKKGIGGQGKEITLRRQSIGKK